MTVTELTRAINKGLVVLCREERDGELSEVALEHAGHCGNVHLLAHIQQRVPPYTQHTYTPLITDSLAGQLYLLQRPCAAPQCRLQVQGPGTDPP